MNTPPGLTYKLIAVMVALPLVSVAWATASPAVALSSDWKKPAWLTDLSLGSKESYDDNVLGVSGDGLSPKSSWITTVSPKVGFNFAPLLGSQKTVPTLSLNYAPDFNFYHGAPSQSFNAHKLGSSIKGKTGNFSFSLDNAFLYNDGNEQAPIYALNQLSGAGANQNDKNRNNYAHGMARERLAQVQDRAAIVLQYDRNQFFIRPTASLLFYDLHTDWHNTVAAPWRGYQNYTDRYDVNGGVDFGCKVTSKLTPTLGYRYGAQYQQQLPTQIDSDQHQSSSDYQRVLLGLEGKPWKWLTAKMAGGPDFRSYDSAAAVNDFHPVKYYGEAALTAIISSNQTVTFNYKQWQWVSSSGKIPYFDSAYTLAYHWNATKQLGVDLGGKVLEANYRTGNEDGVAVPAQSGSMRDDIQYTVSAGVSYAFNPHFSASLNYTYDIGDNAYPNLPAQYQSAYRQFDHQLVSLGLQYKF